MDEKIKKWIDKNITIKLENKNVFITGANSGIGFELAKECAYLNANIFMLIRNLNKGQKAKEDILSIYPSTNIELIELDLSSLESIKNAYEILKTKDIDIFINNAGIFRMPLSYTKDNIEITMATNYIGVLYLNSLLNEYFITLNHPVLNVFTTSITSKMYKINYSDFYSLKTKSYIKRYGRTKVAINNMYYYFLDKYKNSNIIFSLVHPGATYTPLIQKGYKNKVFEHMANIFMKLVFHTPEKAALTDLYAINKDSASLVGPRGFLELSGYPKIIKIKKNKNYMKSVDIGLEEIEKRTK